MYRFFFTNDGNQKKWFILFSILLPFVLSIVFSVWGTALSVKSFKLSVETNNNHEQIDSIKTIINELRNQNKLLIVQNSLLSNQIEQSGALLSVNKKSSDIQFQQFSTILNDINNGKKPRLVVNVIDNDFSQADGRIIITTTLRISNVGGDIINFRNESITGVELDPSFFPQNGFLPGGSYFDLTFENLLEKIYKTRFYFKDELHNSYIQDLFWTQLKDGYSYDFQLSKLKIVK